MRDLDVKIGEWRSRMAAGGIKSPAVLDELESHLREEIQPRLAAGDSPEEAFEIASARIGTPASLRAEFNKLSGATFLPVIIGTSLWAGLTVMLVAVMSMRVVHGRMGAVLFAHFLSLTMGYLGAFSAGGFAIWRVYLHWSPESSFAAQSLERAALRFSGIAGVFTLTALLLGMLWGGQNLGVYWEGSAKQVGTLIAAIWFLCTWAFQQFCRSSIRTGMLACMFGNVVGVLGWWGAGILQADPVLHRFTHYWPLYIFIGAHLLVIAMSFSRRFETAKW